MIITPCRKVQMVNSLERWKLDSKTFDLIGNSPHKSTYSGDVNLFEVGPGLRLFDILVCGIASNPTLC